MIEIASVYMAGFGFRVNDSGFFNFCWVLG
jgi:hypothetical protein